MKKTILLLAALCAGLAHGQTYRWVDQDGKVHYSDRYPADHASNVQKRGISAPEADKQLSYATKQAMTNFPVTLYVTKDCGDSCAQGRDLLAKRAIPFSEKNVATNEEIEALKQLLGGGEAQVPVLQVGSRTYKGWLQESWQRALDAAGYPKAP